MLLKWHNVIDKVKQGKCFILKHSGIKVFYSQQNLCCGDGECIATTSL